MNMCIDENTDEFSIKIIDVGKGHIIFINDSYGAAQTKLVETTDKLLKFLNDHYKIQCYRKEFGCDQVILDMKIEFDFPCGIVSALNSVGVYTVGQLVIMSSSQLLRVNNIGSGSIKKIIETLETYRLELS